MLNRHQRNILSLSWPIILGELSIVIQSIISDLMVAPLGRDSLAAVGFSNAFILNIYLLGFGTFSVLANFVSNYSNQDNDEKCATLLNAALNIAVWLGLIVSVIVFFTAKYVYIFGQDPAVNLLSKEYLLILSIGPIFYFVFVVIMNLIDGLSRTKTSFYFLMGSFIVTTASNYIFIYGKLGFPKMGVRGAAIGTLIGQVSLAIVTYLYYRHSAFLKRYRLPRLCFVGLTEQLEILKLGIPLGGQYLFEYSTFFIINMFMGWISVSASAAHQIVLGPVDFYNLMLNGLGIGSGILVSAEVGKNDWCEVKNYAKNTITITLAIQGILALIFLCGYRLIPSFFGVDESTLHIAATLMLFIAFFQFADGMQNIFLSLLNGLGDTFIPGTYSFFSYWVVAIPASYLLGIHFELGPNGVWGGMFIGLTLALVLLAGRFYRLLSLKSA